MLKIWEQDLSLPWIVMIAVHCCWFYHYNLHSKYLEIILRSMCFVFCGYWNLASLKVSKWLNIFPYIFKVNHTPFVGGFCAYTCAVCNTSMVFNFCLYWPEDQSELSKGPSQCSGYAQRLWSARKYLRAFSWTMEV